MTRLDELRRAAKYKSLKRLGEALCEAVPEEPRKPRSVGAKLSDLNHGKTGWWERNSMFADKLAELLGCSKSEIGIYPEADPLVAYRFEGFPEMRPLDLRREEACRVGYFSHEDRDCSDELDPWLDVRSRVAAGRGVPRGVSWIFFPPGTGLDLFWQRLNVAGSFECMAATSVYDAKDRLLDPTPLCLKVSDSKGRNDREALERRAHQGAVLIVAPFALPEEVVRRSSLERLIANLSDNRVRGYEFRLMHDWRKRLVDWMASRLHAQYGREWDSGPLRRWIRDLPNSEMVSTPRALVEVAGLAYRACPEERLLIPGELDAARQWLSFVIGGAGTTQWELFRDCVKTWFFELSDVPWRPWIEPSDWKRVVEGLGEANPSHEANEVPVPPRAEPVPQEPLFASKPDEVPEAPILLDEADWVETDAMGAVRLTPQVAVHAVVIEELQRLITEGDASHWGAWCFDPERSALVQDALANIDENQIEQCAERVVRNAAFDVANIGAAEAVFLAIGRALEEATHVSRSMIDLRDLVLERLLGDGVAVGQSASAASARTDWWLAACWAWSLYTTRPTDPLPAGWQQFFPGWLDSPSLELHGGIRTPDASAGFADLPPPQQHLMHLAGEIANRTPTALVDAHAVFHPGLLSRAMRDDCLALWAWWETVMSFEWAEDVLSKEARGAKDSTQTLIHLFRAIPRDDAELQRLQLWLLGPSRFKDSLLDTAEAGIFVAALNDGQLAIVTSVFPLMPVSIRREILTHCRDRPDARAWWRRIEDGLAPDLERPDIEREVACWVENPGPESDAAARWLWREKPEQTIEMLESHFGTRMGDKLLENYAEGKKELERLVSLLERFGESSPCKARSFARAQLATSGHLAPRLLALMRR